jgi:hypothetical protein
MGAEVGAELFGQIFGVIIGLWGLGVSLGMAIKLINRS